jgi:putative Mg2+ transporter-C (MgtC) family protein
MICAGTVGPTRAFGTRELTIGGNYLIETFHFLNSLPVFPHAFALAIAYILAFPIGLEREREERSAGVRTFPIVALASCGFIQGTESITNGNPEATARIIEGLITGVGFIGGGAILQLKNSVRGTATAASIWSTGAIGVSVGLESYDVAIIISIFTFLSLRLLLPLKKEPKQD